MMSQSDPSAKAIIFKRDVWEKIGAVSPLLCGILVSIVGTYCTYSYNQQQIKIQQVQTIGSFIPHLMGNEQSKKAAILALYTMTDSQTASKFAQIFASTGTVSALQSMSRTGSETDKTIASQALTNTLQNMAQQDSLSKLEGDYQKKLLNMNDSGKDDSYTAYNMTKLAQLYIMRRQYELAEPLLQRSLVLRGKLYGQDNPELCDTLRSLAEVYFQTGRINQAESEIKRVHAIEQKLEPSLQSSSLATSTPANNETGATPTTNSETTALDVVVPPPSIVDDTAETTTNSAAKTAPKETDKQASQSKAPLGHQG
jgi:tetratricopeptide (TPR) repeat protein